MKPSLGRTLVAGFLIALMIMICWEVDLYAQNSANLGVSLLSKFTSQTDGWWLILRGKALQLFKLTLTIEVCLFGVRMVLQRTEPGEIFGQFVTLLLFAGFIAAVILNYREWAEAIAINGLKELVPGLTGNQVDAGTPIAIMSALAEKIVETVKGIGITSAIVGPMLLILIFIIIIVVLILISALYIITVCEFYVAANVGILLIGLGGSRLFKDYAINVMRYVLAIGIKLLTLQLILNIGFTILTVDSVAGGDFSIEDIGVKYVAMLYMLTQAIILLALAKSLPDTISGIINGSSLSSGNPLISASRAVGAATVGAVTGGAGLAAGAAGAAQSAYTVAKGNGATGVTGTLTGMAKATWSAYGEARAAGAQKSMEAKPNSIINQLKSKANAVRTARKIFS